MLLDTTAHLTWLIASLILILALVQSLFGVGILLFGTPLLLSFGFSYEQTLFWLLPASAALSWSQVWELRHEKLDYAYRKRFFQFCVPVLLMSLYLSLHINLLTPTKAFVLVMLCMSVALRLHKKWHEKLQLFFQQHIKAGLALIGFIHGLSNMGGSVLTVLASSLYPQKTKALAAISLDYAFMASLQYLLLVCLKPEYITPYYFLGIPLALASRYLLGRPLFAITQHSIYQRLITLLLICNGVLLSWTLFVTTL